jgi:hypothetical protein
MTCGPFVADYGHFNDVIVVELLHSRDYATARVESTPGKGSTF